jgi:methionine-rich copper-binding protein CopC
MRRRSTFALVIAVATMLVPAPASAAERPASSSPVPGALVQAPPPVVTLMMRTPVARAEATVTDGCGRQVPGAVVVAGERVSIRLAIDHAGIRHEDHSRAGGTWRIDWRTVSADGGKASGRVPFVLAGPPQCATATADTEAAPIPRSQAPAGPPRALLWALYAVAGLAIAMTGMRFVQRRRALTPGTDPMVTAR